MDSKIKLIFFGTPVIASKCLKAILNDDAFEVSAVVTQEDKPVGRRKIITPPDVKIVAAEKGLSIYQPSVLNDDTALYDRLKRFKPDYNVVVAYGQVMSKEWLFTPSIRSLNLHVSLLPKYRGASPMQEAILHGDRVTGVTIQEMSFKMDTGNILAQESFEIGDNDTFSQVYETAGDIGARLLVETLKADFAGDLTPTPQDESQASYCTKITKEDGRVDFIKMTARAIYNKYRAYKEWPGIWTMLDGKRLKLTEIRLADDADFESGQIFAKCKDGIIEILKCQIEGKKEVAATQMLLRLTPFSSRFAR